MIEIQFNPGRVANLLKKIVNSQCENGFKWYEDIGEMPTIFDINQAIKMLETQKTDSIFVAEEEDDENQT